MMVDVLVAEQVAELQHANNKLLDELSKARSEIPKLKYGQDTASNA